MILVIGGAYQGKEKFAESLREQEKKAGRERIIVPQFHEWVKNCMKAEQNIEEELREKLAQEPDQIIVCDELGCGVHLNVHGGSVPDGLAVIWQSRQRQYTV